MKKRNVIFIMGIVLIIISSLIIINNNKTVAQNTTNIDFQNLYVENQTKPNINTLRNYVLATARQYLFKQTATDYEQKAMDEKLEYTKNKKYATFSFRSLVTEPEQLNSASKVIFDCSSFVTNVYLNTFGYYFGDYFEYSDRALYTENKNFKIIANSSANVEGTSESYYRAIKETGQGISTKMMSNIAKAKFKDYAPNLTKYSEVEKGKIYKNDKNSVLVPFYYKLNINTKNQPLETATTRKTVYNELKSTLKTGDLLVVRTTASKGHVMLYVAGDNSNKYDLEQEENEKYGKLWGNLEEGGFIHAMGSDYSFEDKDGHTSLSGLDKFSIRFWTYDYIIENRNHGGAKGYIFGPRKEGHIANEVFILRPLADITKNNYNNFFTQTKATAKINKNAIARLRLTNLKVEENAILTKLENNTRKETKKLSKYNSISKRDVIKFKLSTKHMNKAGTNYIIHVNDDLSDDNCLTYVQNSCQITGDTNGKCQHSNGKISFTSITVKPNKEVTMSYLAKINTNCKAKKLTKKGMTVKHNSYNEKLHMADIVVNINPKYGNTERNKIINAKNNINKAIKNGSLTVVSKAQSGYVSSTKITSDGKIKKGGKIKLTSTQVLKSLYYNALNVKLGYFENYNKEGKKDTLFNKIDEETYERDIQDSSLETMVVPGLYGGRQVRGNFEKKDRVNRIDLNYLEIGDIIVPKNAKYSMIYIGTNSKNECQFIFYSTKQGKLLTGTIEKNSKTNTIKRRFYSIIRKGTFVILRPSMKFANQVKINTNGGSIVKNEPTNVRLQSYNIAEDNNIVEDLDIYSDEYLEDDDEDIIENVEENIEESSEYEETLIDIEKEIVDSDTNIENNTIIYSNEVDEEETLPKASKNITIKLDGNSGSISGNEIKEIAITGIAEEWYSDKELTQKVNSVEEILEKGIEEIYPKYEFPNIDLPEATKEGYIFAGWYTTKNGGSKIISKNYTTTENVTLYANYSEETEIEVTGITLNIPNQGDETSSSINMKKDEKITLTATVRPENASNKNYKFYSSNEDVITINEKGEIIAKKDGIATITVKTENEKYVDSCVISVTVPVKEIILEKTTLDLNINESKKLNFEINPTTATNQEVTWTSSNPEIVSVDETGQVTAKKGGSATITVMTVDGSLEAICSVNVKNDITEIIIDKKEVTLKPGDIEKLTATINPSDIPNKELEWISNAPNIVNVDQNGNIEAIDNGKATITVTTLDGNYMAECSVTVKPIIKTIELNKKSLILSISENETLEAIITPEDAIDQTIIWTSNNNNIVSVDKYGNITANSSGTATISATSENGKITSSCEVTVLNENEYKLTYIVDNNIYEEVYSTHQEIALNKNITKKGHKLISWRDNDTSIEYDLNEKIIMGNSNIKLIANFELIIPDINEISEYKTYQNYISSIKPETNVMDLEINITDDYDIKVLDKEDKIKENDEVIVTGDKLQILLEEEVLKEYDLIIKGDITGDGKVNLIDFKKTYDYYKGKIKLNSYYKEAADIISTTNTKKNQIRIDDIKKLYQYIIGKIDDLEE